MDTMVDTNTMKQKITDSLKGRIVDALCVSVMSRGDSEVRLATLVGDDEAAAAAAAASPMAPTPPRGPPPVYMRNATHAYDEEPLAEDQQGEAQQNNHEAHGRN